MWSYIKKKEDQKVWNAQKCVFFLKRRSHVLMWRRHRNVRKTGNIYRPLASFSFPGHVGAFLPRGLQAVLPNTDKLHVRRFKPSCPKAESVHHLPVAAAYRGRHRNTSVICRPSATQWAGAAARPAHPHWAARQWQGNCGPTKVFWEKKIRIYLCPFVPAPYIKEHYCLRMCTFLALSQWNTSNENELKSPMHVFKWQRYHYRSLPSSKVVKCL